MQIKSPFRDYYDKYQVFDGSPFIRNIAISHKEYKDIQRYRDDKCFNVGFCGEIYTGIHIPAFKYDDRYWSRCKESYDERFLYSLEEYSSFYKEIWGISLSTENKRELSGIFKVEKDNTPFIEHSAPIFISMDEIQYHTMGRPKFGVKRDIYTLERFQFDKIKPANIAYMEIEQYVSGVLTREHKAVPEMDNATKIASHGFDKYSFRN
jgi:hypothetical protein